MHKLQVRVGGQGRGGHGHAGQAPQPELVRKPHRQLHPHRRHRMARPEADEGLRISAYTAEPGSASQDALNLLASWAATLDAAGSASSQPGQPR